MCPVYVLLLGDVYLAMYALFLFFFVISCFLGDVMVFKFYAKVRSLSEGVVQLFHNNLCFVFVLDMALRAENDAIA